MREHISFQNYEILDEAIEALSRGEIDACIYHAPVLRDFAHRNFGGTIEVLPARFQSASCAFVLPPDSPLREKVNRTLLAEIESDGWPDRVERLLGR